MLSIKDKISKMDTQKLEKLQTRILQSLIISTIVSIALFVLIIYIAKMIYGVENDIIISGAYIAMCIFSVIYILFFVVFGNAIDTELKKREEKSEKIPLLIETEKQVKIINDYSLVLEGLLENGTITAKYIKETNKVALRFKMVDDEGKTFYKLLEFDADDLEIL